jgi:BirA family biotin operon repressor/biotin-[acetyl-CoA-carboxylase] ligase
MTSSFPYECLDSVDSTNTLLKNRSDLWSQNFYTIRALKQTDGRGRYGRTWFSGTDNLTFSFIFNGFDPSCPVDISPLTLYAGLALRKALGKITGVQILVKWPNDVTFHGKKLGGILTEMIQTGESKVVIFGIGVNLNADKMPADLVDKTISLKEITNQNLSPEMVLNEIMFEMKSRLQTFKIPLSKTIRAEFTANCDKKANMVTIFDRIKKSVIKKRFDITGINENGLLCVVDEYGNQDLISAHDLEFNQDV